MRIPIPNAGSSRLTEYNHNHDGHTGEFTSGASVSVRSQPGSPKPWQVRHDPTGMTLGAYASKQEATDAALSDLKQKVRGEGNHVSVRSPHGSWDHFHVSSTGSKYLGNSSASDKFWANPTLKTVMGVSTGSPGETTYAKKKKKR